MYNLSLKFNTKCLIQVQNDRKAIFYLVLFYIFKVFFNKCALINKLLKMGKQYGIPIHTDTHTPVISVFAHRAVVRHKYHNSNLTIHTQCPIKTLTVPFEVRYRRSPLGEKVLKSIIICVTVARRVFSTTEYPLPSKWKEGSSLWELQSK